VRGNEKDVDVKQRISNAISAEMKKERRIVW